MTDTFHSNSPAMQKLLFMTIHMQIGLKQVHEKRPMCQLCYTGHSVPFFSLQYKKVKYYSDDQLKPKTIY